MFYLFVIGACFLLQLIFSWAVYTFLVWVGAPQFLVIALTASAWVSINKLVKK